MKRIINVIGLPGSGKTTFSDMLASRLGAARVNADYVRDNISTDLGFSLEDRIVQAERMAHISNLALTGSNNLVVTDFVNPSRKTRKAFLAAVKFPVFTVWMNTLEEGRFPDTNKLFRPPTDPDFVIEGWHSIDELDRIAQDFVHEVVDTIERSLRKYHIRFNTACNKDPSIPHKWRIFDVLTGEERLAKSFHISGSRVMPARSYDENNVEKWNIQIRASLFWEGDHAYFVSS